MMTATQIIDGLGGTSAVAKFCGDMTPSTVSSWKTSNSIPRWWRSKLLEMAVEVGFALSTADFPKRVAA